MQPIVQIIATAVVATVALGAALAQAPQAVGEVVKVDRPGARITLRHGGVANLELPAMTMAFRVRDTRMLDGIEAGDRVRFAVEKIQGNFTVTVLVKAS